MTKAIYDICSGCREKQVLRYPTEKLCANCYSKMRYIAQKALNEPDPKKSLDLVNEAMELLK